MAILPAYPLPTPGTTLNSVADPELLTALQGVLAGFNGSIDFANLSSALQSTINSGTVGPRAVVSIPASQTLTAPAAFTTMTTPDQVAGLVLPTNGLFAVWYQATWQESVAGAARAAIFLGANEAVITQQQSAGGGGPFGSEAATGGGIPAAINQSLTSSAVGLISSNLTVAYGGDVSTGQIVGVQVGVNNTHGATASVSGGGPCYIFAAAGTYTVGVQFKTTSGNVTASNRTLRVQVQAFS